ncbi:hypothetical protein Cni_G23663 [Canna indica]|uniref:Uncharacterized protein n=1 Tax=Canna indica TaxID=4628 RepID=A0AAQ3L0S1_9LILI|nr:hypothetical protein Cni_G23663 [Canna indica]
MFQAIKLQYLIVSFKHLSSWVYLVELLICRTYAITLSVSPCMLIFTKLKLWKFVRYPVSVTFNRSLMQIYVSIMLISTVELEIICVVLKFDTCYIYILSVMHYQSRSCSCVCL